MIMVASLAATFYAYFRAPGHGLSQLAILDCSIFGTLAGFFGARLFHVVVEAPDYYWADPIRFFYIWQGGFVGYGAFIGVAAAILIYAWVKKLDVLEYADHFALACPLIIFFIRIGCLGAGCCYGTPTDFFLHLTFTHPASDAARDHIGVSLHATQIYDMLNAAFVFGAVHFIYARRKYKGQAMLAFFAIYAFFRFLIEFLRGDEDRGLFFDGLLSTSQITGIIIIGVCFVFYVILSKKYPT